MSIAVREFDLRVINLRTRMPFRYGIATLTALPHLIVRVEAEINGRRQAGFSADHLPPKWFTKDLHTAYRDDIADMLAVITNACRLATERPAAATVFGFWQQLYAAQKQWAAGTKHPPLLWGFGVSLVERAVIDAFCRASGQPFARALNDGSLGIRWQGTPLRQIIVRHTVGLGDPLTGLEEIDDGLPQTLAAGIRESGLTHFKIKLCGNPAADLARLRALADIMPNQFAFTLDGNEQYNSLDAFRTFWESAQSLQEFLRHLIFVEQPLHRDVALRVNLNDWRDRPPIIIDESDAELTSFATALDLGYAGTSHKNCKGVFKSIANAALAKQRGAILSGEDLANVGPVALLQDLAVVAALGITHAERNGHHYFRGLSAGSEEILAHHGDLYRRHPRGFVTLNVRRGCVSVESVVAAPFGVGFVVETGSFTPLADWRVESLGV